MNGGNVVGRTSYALMSLTAAVPGFLLAAALTVAFLQHADQMPGLLPAVAGVAWLVAVLMAVTPVGILLFGGPKSARGGESAKAAAAAPATDESFVAEESLSEEVEGVSDDDWNEGDSAVDFAEAEGDEFEFEDESSGEFDADFDFDEDAKR